jgi:hypothetical protein
MSRSVQRAAQILPLLGTIWLLRFLPQINAAPLHGRWPLPWRLDGLTLCFIISLTLSAALVPLSRRDTLRALAALLLCTALVGEHMLLLPLALIGVGGILWNWRWLLAGALLTIGVALLWFGGGATWYAPETATAITSSSFLLILAACSIGVNSYPIARLPQPADPLRHALQPIWLLPLLRTIEWGPWNNGWALAVLVLGGVTALWASSQAVWTNSQTRRVEHILGAWLGMAFACVGLLTTVGIASALWHVLAYGFAVGLLLRADRRVWWAGPLPPTTGFVAGWLAQGATAASGAFLLAGAFWLTTLFSGIAIFRLRAETAKTRPISRISTILVGLVIALGVLAPVPLRWLIVPAIEPLQGGLTPFGLLDIWPWVGMAALDAGHRRVAVLPSIAVVVLLIVTAALVWLLARLFGWSDLRPSADEQPGPQLPTLWEELRQQVWWSRGPGQRG